MDNVDLILDYAQSHNMRARMHNLLWGDNSFNGQQPSWVLNGNSTSGLLDQAYLGTNPNAAADLRGEISERIDHYVGSGTPRTARTSTWSWTSTMKASTPARIRTSPPI